MPEIKNQDGSKGKICNYCGGYGFTNNLQGGASGCYKCDQTGVALPDPRELEAKLKELEALVKKYGDSG